MNAHCDIIGDIHGHADQLETLLAKLGYRHNGENHKHPHQRQLIFLGDLIDGGPQNKKALELVRPMVGAEVALIVMGNHELNAICYHTQHPSTGQYIRSHNDSHNEQHQSFLDEFPIGTPETNEVIEWFKTLPLYLEIDGLRAIHACWNDEAIEQLNLGKGRVILPHIHAMGDSTSEIFRNIEILLKGPEISLPSGHSFLYKNNHLRKNIRTRWWGNHATTYREYAQVHEEAIDSIPDTPLPKELLAERYPDEAPPVFFGHYWFTGDPAPLTHNTCCLDYSVAKGGKLVAYRRGGEKLLSQKHLVSV